MLPQMSAQERAKLAESMPKEQGIAEAKRNLPGPSFCRQLQSRKALKLMQKRLTSTLGYCCTVR